MELPSPVYLIDVPLSYPNERLCLVAPSLLSRVAKWETDNLCGTFAGGTHCLVIRLDPRLSPYDTEHHPVTSGCHSSLTRQTTGRK